MYLTGVINMMIKIKKNVAMHLCDTLPLAGESVLALEGCKLYARKRGAVTHYWLGGYAANGGDVARALIIAQEKARLSVGA